MKTTQENKLLAYRALKGVCEANQSVWTKMKSFADDFAQFTDMVEGIEDFAKAQASPTTGITQDKRNLRRAMARAAMAIAGSGAVGAGQTAAQRGQAGAPGQEERGEEVGMFPR